MTNNADIGFVCPKRCLTSLSQFLQTSKNPLDFGKAIWKPVYPVPTRKSRIDHNTPAAAFPFPRNFLAPSFLRSENLSREASNASLTNP
ncbi:MAG: hypothetical protein AB8D78_03535 [Akkermansiaceae bacterium]